MSESVFPWVRALVILVSSLRAWQQKEVLPTCAFFRPFPQTSASWMVLTPVSFVFGFGHQYLPLNGSYCILAICGMDRTAPISPPGFLTSSGWCVLHLLPGLNAISPHSHLQSSLLHGALLSKPRQKAAYYGGIKCTCGLTGCQILALPFTYWGTWSLIEPPCLILSVSNSHLLTPLWG